MPESAQPVSKAGRTAQPTWPRLTLEAVLYAALVAGAAFIRFYALGRWPLLAEEARRALAAWRFLQGQGTSASVAPLLFDGALASFFAFGASDGAARLLPALLGTALVFLPLPLRRHLGRWGALAAAFILAFSPTLVYYSRTLAGPVPALAGLGAVLWALELAAVHRPEQAKLVGGVGLALALTSCPWTYTFLLAAALFFGLGRLARRYGRPWPGWAASENALRPVVNDGRAWAVLGLLLVPVSTALLLNIGGVQGVADLLAAWLARLVPGAAGQSWLYPLGILAYYEVGVLLLGLAGLWIALRGPNPWSRFVGTWTVVALALATLSGARDGGPVAMIVLPLALLSGLTVSAAANRLERAQWTWVGVGVFVFVVLLGFWWLNLAAFSSGYPDALRRDPLLVALLALATPLALAGAIAIFHSWVGRAETRWALSIVGLALVAGLLVRSSVSLNFAHARDPREPLVVAPSSPDLKDMVAFLEDWSVRRALDQHALSIGVQEDLEPLVSWYLRDFSDLELIHSPGPAPEHGALVLEPRQGGAGPAGYVGQRYRLQTWSDAPLGDGRQGLAWWLLGTGGGSVQARMIELWVRYP